MIMILHKTKTFLCSGIFILIFSGFSALGAQEFPSENSFNSQWDWHVGATYSPLYTGMYKNVWDTVEYLAILQREGSSKERKLAPMDSFGVGGFAGLGWVFYNQDNVRVSFGGEYSLSFFQNKGIYTFGERSSEGADYSYAPATGSKQELTLKGLDHKLSPYLKVSFLGSSFPIDLQLNVGVSLVHLLSMDLKDHDGKTYQATIKNPNQPIELKGETGFLIPKPSSYSLNFGMKNTTHLALTTGLRASFLDVLFVGLNYTTNVLQHSYDVQVGLSFKNNFFKDAWK